MARGEEEVGGHEEGGFGDDFAEVGLGVVNIVLVIGS